MPAGGSCLLGSLNLSEFIINPYTTTAKFDYDSFVEAIHIAVKGLNNVLDEGLELHPLQEQKDSVKKWRQIGLGIMGLADALIKLGIKYGSDKSICFIQNMIKTMMYQALFMSSLLAKETEPFSKFNFDSLTENELFKTIIDPPLNNFIKQYGLRNSQLLTCAPTGSIATMLNISGGVEPLFATSWTRKTESLHGKDIYYKQYPKIISELMQVMKIEEEIDLPSYVVVSHEIKPMDRIKVQSALQQYIDASISSTINLPNSATIKDIENIYIEAWRKGLKGVTIYRDGCKRSGILTTEETKEIKEKDESPKRGEVLKIDDDKVIGLKKKLISGCGSLHCAAYFDVETGDLKEIYLSKGSTGGCNNFMTGLSRIISMSARAGVKIDDIVDQLMSTGACPSYVTRTKTKHDTSKGSCCPMAVGYALKEMWEEFQGKEMKPKEQKNETSYIAVKNDTKLIAKCPECGEPLIFEGGCNICKSCGWSKCD